MKCMPILLAAVIGLGVAPAIAQTPASAPAAPVHNDAIVKMRQDIAAARKTYSAKVADAKKVFDAAKADAAKERDAAIKAARAAANQK